jgi:hypothetical protein
MHLPYLQLCRLHRLLLSKPGRSLRRRTLIDLTGNHLPTVELRNPTIAARMRPHHSDQCAANRLAPDTIPK